jgi:hypothetical protein
MEYIIKKGKHYSNWFKFPFFTLRRSIKFQFMIDSSSHYTFNNEDDYLESMLHTNPVVANMTKALSPENVEKFKAELKLEYIKRMGPEVLDPKHFEILVITAEKP